MPAQTSIKQSPVSDAVLLKTAKNVLIPEDYALETEEGADPDRARDSGQTYLEFCSSCRSSNGLSMFKAALPSGPKT